MSGEGHAREKVRARIVVRGRVQGVFYRASAQAEGRRLGLVGEVRNLPGGEVEAIVEGERARIDELVAWCRRGPPAARVDGVEVQYAAPQGGFRAFDVAR